VKLHFSHEVVHISASDLCGLAVTTCGAVYTWGDGDLGQLGHGDTITQFVPKRVAALEQYKVVTASMEYRCTALTQNEAFVWGLGENGEIPSLPTSAGAMHCSPVPLAGLPPSVQLCEVSGNLLLSDTGEVFRVVYAEASPELEGCPKDGTIPFIERVACLEGTRVAGIAAGDCNCDVEIVISQRGEALMLAAGGYDTMEQRRQVQPSRIVGHNHPAGLRGVRAASAGVICLLSCEDTKDGAASTKFYSFGQQNDCGLFALGQGDAIGVVSHGGSTDYLDGAPKILSTFGQVQV